MKFVNKGITRRNECIGKWLITVTARSNGEMSQ
jgi:hypothetical protein